MILYKIGYTNHVSSHTLCCLHYYELLRRRISTLERDIIRECNEMTLPSRFELILMWPCLEENIPFYAQLPFSIVHDP